MFSHSSIRWPIGESTYLPTCQSVSLPFCHGIFLPVCLSISLLPHFLKNGSLVSYDFLKVEVTEKLGAQIFFKVRTSLILREKEPK